MAAHKHVDSTIPPFFTILGTLYMQVKNRVRIDVIRDDDVASCRLTTVYILGKLRELITSTGRRKPKQVEGEIP